MTPFGSEREWTSDRRRYVSGRSPALKTTSVVKVNAGAMKDGSFHISSIN